MLSCRPSQSRGEPWALQLALLGPFETRLAGKGIRIRRRKAQALLAYLAMHRGERQPRERLISLLWEDAAPAQARHSLRQTLATLRRDLMVSRRTVLMLAGEELFLEPGEVIVDVTRFERLALSSATNRLDQAAALYRGDFLAGLVTGSETFDRWLVTQRERLRATVLDVLRRLLTSRIEAGAWLPATHAAIKLLEIDPLREDIHRVLMDLYARAGHRTLALRQYQRCRSLLRRELGLAPADETIAQYRALLDRAWVGHRDLAAADPQVSRHWSLAVDGAVARSAFPEAVSCLEGVLSTLGRRPAGRAALRSRVDTHLGFARALLPLGELDRLRGHLEAAEAAARRLRDQRCLGWVAVQRISYEVLEGDAAAAVELGERALARAEAAGDTELAVAARRRLAQAYYHWGDFRRGARLAQELSAELHGDLAVPLTGYGILPAVECRVYVALCETELGEFAAGRAAALEGIQLAERAAHTWSLAVARKVLAICDLSRGDVDAACEAVTGARDLQQVGGDRPRFAVPCEGLGHAYALAGKPKEAFALLEPEARSAGSIGRRRRLVSLAQWRLLEGRIREARQYAEEAVGLARAQHQRGAEASALHLLSQALARLAQEEADAADKQRALAVCLEALRNAESLGMRALVARCHDTLAKLWDDAGNSAQADAARRAASALCNELGIVLRPAPSAATPAVTAVRSR